MENKNKIKKDFLFQILYKVRIEILLFDACNSRGVHVWKKVKHEWKKIRHTKVIGQSRFKYANYCLIVLDKISLKLGIINLLEYSACIQKFSNLTYSEIELNNKVAELNIEITIWTRKHKALTQKRAFLSCVLIFTIFYFILNFVKIIF